MASASDDLPGHIDPINTERQPPASKQAVVMIHGIGEQQPMDTIKSFVRAVWETDTGIAPKWDPEAQNIKGSCRNH
jgi:hypothetical protein